MIEKWKTIPDYENYKVSNLGIVKNINYRGTGKEKILKGTSYNNYVYVTLRKNNESKTFLLHRLVAQAFIPNVENKPCINHIDCNRKNNKVNNLEWCTQQENIAYMDKKNRRVGNKKMTEQDVKNIRDKKKKGLFYKNVWQEYKDKISFSGFQKIWYKMDWKKLKGDSDD